MKYGAPIKVCIPAVAVMLATNMASAAAASVQSTPAPVGPSSEPMAPASPPRISQQALDATRRSYVTQLERSLREAAPLLKLDAAQMQRLVTLLADRLTADMQSGVRRQYAGEILTPGAYAQSIAGEFGADVAERWTAYEKLRSGLPFVDRQLKLYYNAGEPLNANQRLRLASDYQQVTLAAVRSSVVSVTGPPAAPGTPIANVTNITGITGITAVNPASTGMAQAIQRMSTELASAEATNSAVLAAARAYLSKTQLEVLSSQLEVNVATRRQTLRMMREASGATN